MEEKNIPTISIERIKKAISNLQERKFPKYDPSMDVTDFVKSIIDILSNEFGIIINTVKPFKLNGFKLDLFRVRELESFSIIFTQSNIGRYGFFPKSDVV